jgi:hypothetical protein
MTLGTAGSFNHILIPWADWHGDQADSMTALMLARMLTPWGPTPDYPNFTTAGGDYYHEANLVGSPIYAAGAVKFVLAQFAQHFGTESGAGLRRWAAQHGWPLIWAWGIGDRPILSMPRGTWAGTRRVLDPASLLSSRAGGNLSALSKPAALLWERAWKTAAIARNTSTVVEGTIFNWWEAVAHAAGVALTVEPVRAGACGAPHDCVGVDPEGHCVCYGAADLSSGPLEGPHSDWPSMKTNDWTRHHVALADVG